MGRMWALLYTEPKPMPAAEIGEALQMSAGAVSMTLADLGKWGVVRRSWIPGDRRDFFEAETSIWKLVSRVVRERELLMIREAKDSFAAADRTLAASMQGATPDEKRRRTFERERIGQLRSLTEIGERLLSSLVAGEPVSTAPLASLSTQAANDDARRRRR
jgi:DNA-binding transcriptional regulator GbsR (MarR family)